MAKDVVKPEILAEDFAIDPLRLDVEWVAQAERTRKYGRKLARKRLAFDDAELELELYESRMHLKIRNNPAKYDITGRLSNEAIKAATQCQPEYKELRQAVNLARYEMENFKSASNSMDHKKKALEDLVVLQGRDYYAEPYLNKEVTPEVVNHIKRRSRAADAARRSQSERE